MTGWRGLVIAIAAEVALTVVLTKVVGTPAVWSVLVALPLAALVYLLLAAPPGIEPAWAPPPEPPAVAGHLEASTLAGRLEDAGNDQGRYRTRVQPRLAAVALSALRRRPGLADLSDLTDPRAAAELGPRWHAALTDPAATLPSPEEVRALLAKLEEQ